jgi:hypothetical protein
MKQFVFFSLCLFATSANANIRTVSNNPATIGHHNTIQSAVDAASSGDTIYVHGSPNNYAGFNINNKKLTIIGPGWSPDKTLPHTANVIEFINVYGAGSSGTELQGLSLYCPVTIQNTGINNLKFVRNRLVRTLIYLTPNAPGTLSGYLFQGNWFDNSGVISNPAYTLENMLFQNNIFYENGCCLGSSVSGFTNTVNVLFDHNLFYGPGNGVRDIFSSNCRFLIVSNNVFVRRNAANHLSSSTFNNNITFNTGNDAPWNVNSNVNSGGNIEGQDPQIAAQAGVDAGTNDPLLDFTIAAGPANNSGSDGKDMGLLFDNAGSLNWFNSRNSRLPRIYNMNVTTPTVAPGGSVSVTVESRTSN